MSAAKSRVRPIPHFAPLNGGLQPWETLSVAQIAIAMSALPLAVGRAEDVAHRRQHHVVEVLREHRRREERHRPQLVGAYVGEVVPHVRRQHEHAARPDRIVAVLGLQLALAGDDVLRLLGGVGVPAELPAGLDLVDDGRGLARPVAAIDREGRFPADSLIVR